MPKGDKIMEGWKKSVGKTFLMIGVCLSASALAFGLEPDVEQEVKTILSRYMTEAPQGYMNPSPVHKMVREHRLAVVPYLEEYLSDPCDSVRWHAHVLLRRVGLDANDVVVRQVVVEKLLIRLRDDAALGNKQWLANRLLVFTSADFSQGSRELLQELFVEALGSWNKHLQADIILLVGVAELKSELLRLKEFIDENEGKLKQQHDEYIAYWRQTVEKMPQRMRGRYARTLKKQYWQKSLVWAALRARARMGVEEDVERCIELVESHPDEDYRVGWLLQELSYVRQPEVVDYLYQYLQSDKVREPGGRDTHVGTYAQRAGQALAHMLRGFPGGKKIWGGPELVEKRRKWMAEQKEWDIIR
jgi:hypothetical protein